MIRIKRMLLVFMAIVLVLPSFIVTPNERVAAEGSPGEFTTKDEVVYATLSPSGERQEIYVVNIFDVVKEGTIVDHGTYSNLKNLTDLSEIEQADDGAVEFTAPEGKFYYQGNRNDAQLPWDITVSYLLDGKKIAPEEIAGKDGHVEIEINTSANENVDQVFFENYMLQVSLTLEPEVFSNIETADGMIANAGKNKQITFTVMPEQEGEINLEADAIDFELQGMEIAAVPQSMNIDTPDVDDMTGDMKSLTDAIKEINNGVGDLNSGVSELNDGVAGLRDGSGQFKQGISDISGSSAGLVDASVSIDEGLATMSKSLSESGEMDLSMLEKLPAGLSELAGGLHQTADGLTELNDEYAGAYSALDAAMVAIPKHEITKKEIDDIRTSGADSDVVEKLVDTYSKALEAKGTYDETKEAFAAVGPALTGASESVDAMANKLDETVTKLASSLEGMDVADSLGQLQEGLSALSTNYKDFHAGLVGYTEGVGQLSDSYTDVHAGIVELSGGTNELEDGVDELHDGTDELYESTKDMPDQMQEEVDQMIADYDKSDFEAISFASADNEKINSVQFVIKTESIEMEEQEPTEDKVEEEKGFWDKLIDLFK